MSSLFGFAAYQIKVWERMSVIGARCQGMMDVKHQNSKDRTKWLFQLATANVEVSAAKVGVIHRLVEAFDC
jgi:hypothetical protein